ncbi:hypothetical protein BJY24_000422 [Nocardia transvalensis]|uniref:Uncharacterized protein n=1 Tax=Nocardia transvalensis TaxID=37333 RepID=A0A7W9P8W9_9NOCA|nr:hypothetical protein [Nocardia transvalensis]MBB5911555.1 hypothetical protein [Nocardia transvalensis]
MADDAAPPPASPLADAIKNAQDGNLTVSFSRGSPDSVRINADEFVYIDRDCEAFKNEIRDLQVIAQNISDRERWGLGETTPGMDSANTLVGRFRGKAKIIDPSKDSENNVYSILEEHYKIVDDIQTLHRTIAEKLMQQDQEFAARYNEVKATMEPSPIGTPMQPGVTTVAVGQSK